MTNVQTSFWFGVNQFSGHTGDSNGQWRLNNGFEKQWIQLPDNKYQICSLAPSKKSSFQRSNDL